MSVARVLAAALLPAVVATLAGPAGAALPGAQRALVARYVDALAAGRYDRAFALLSSDERRYFGTVANFASGFRADRVRVASYSIVASKAAALGTVAIVLERVTFFDPARQRSRSATAKVTYGIVRDGNAYAIKDPFHPWRALVPQELAAQADGVRVTVRKFSFYTGHLEMVATFANASDRAVTFLPYARTALRDQDGKTYAPIASRLPGLTDRTLYEGLRLPAGGEYTGQMSFLTPNRFAPKTLSLVIAPALAEGGEAPFDLTFSVYTLPATPP